MSETVSAPLVLFLSGDLIFASRVGAAAESAGLRFQFSTKLPRERSPEIAFVIVDLSTRGGVVGELMAVCGEHCPDAKVIAYAPHVQVAKIQTARQAGIPTVLTRGQFDAALSTMFRGN